MGMIETNDILASITTLTLDADEFLRINVVAVVSRVRTCIAAACGRGHDPRAVIVEPAQQNATAFVRIRLFAVAPDFGVIAWLDVVAVTLASTMIIGVLLVIGGAFQVIHAFMTKEWRGFLFGLLSTPC